MKTFIKVIEIWMPDEDRTQLVFGSGLYGSLLDFKNASEYQHFAYDEGLPGKAWAAGHPIVLKHFERSYFKRTQAAQQAGLTCGIALPIFAGDFLLAVVVFLCGDDDEQAGAIEVWRKEPGTGDELHVLDGYYGSLKQFETFSKQTKMSKSQGIPGIAWATGMPVLTEDIGNDPKFIRSSYAQEIGMTTALGIPVFNSPERSYVMTFLSAKATPIAKRIQIWIPDQEGKHLLCQQGYSKASNGLAEIFETITVTKGIGALGRVWLTGIPCITGVTDDINYNPALDNLNSMLAIPVIEAGFFKAIVTFLF
ncbi:MAG: GAF domain-containing protein [Methyloglobulus sp.]|nr:GAF domain-containing protein [Methyloglobulus sp.]